MPRTARTLVVGGHYHLINRGNNRGTVYSSRADYDSFVCLIEQAQSRIRLSLLAVCLMPNHFHLVVAQDRANDISRWMHWLLTTFSTRHHGLYGSCGRLWQGRFKAFPIEQDDHLLTVMRYVERNALRAGLVSIVGTAGVCQPAEALRQRRMGPADSIEPGSGILDSPPRQTADQACPALWQPGKPGPATPARKLGMSPISSAGP
jgi:putative transposase